jgi:hypothetical protein
MTPPPWWPIRPDSRSCSDRRISAEYKYTRFRNTINAFTNTPADGATNTVHDRNFDDSVNTPSFFSFVYPTERVVLAAFVRELINYKSTFNTDGVFLTDPTSGTLQRLLPVSRTSRSPRSTSASAPPSTSKRKTRGSRTSG